MLGAAGGFGPTPGCSVTAAAGSFARAFSWSLARLIQAGQTGLCCLRITCLVTHNLVGTRRCCFLMSVVKSFRLCTVSLGISFT